MRKRNCQICGTELYEGRSQCHRCKNVWVDRAASSGGALPSSLAEIKADQVRRISTGPWDYVFGTSLGENGEILDEGITMGTTFLLGGEPGGGKSTLALQIAQGALDARPGDYVLLVLTEEAPVQCKLRCMRLRLRHLDRIHAVQFQGGEHTIQSLLLSLPRSPLAIVVDSTDKIESIQQEMSDVKQYVTQHGGFAGFVHHVNKGMEFAGAMSVQHEVDATFAMMISARTKDGDVRTLATVKNRFGRAGLSFDFEMSDTGLVPHLENPIDNQTPPSDSDEELIEIDEHTIPSKDEFLAHCPATVQVEDSTVTSEMIWRELVSRSRREEWEIVEQLLSLANYCWPGEEEGEGDEGEENGAETPASDRSCSD